MAKNGKGRPRKTGQTKPLIFDTIRSRVTRQLTMSAKTAQLLQNYVEWAAEYAEEAKEDAEILLLDKALGQFIERDVLFQEHLEEELQEGEGVKDEKTAAEKPAQVTPISSASPPSPPKLPPAPAVQARVGT
jgi:hypothetical protein